MVPIEHFNVLLKRVGQELAEDPPEIIVALPTGGLWVAAGLAKKLGVPSQNVISVQVEKTDDGHYHVRNDLIQVVEKAFKNRKVLVVDDSSNRGLLLERVVAFFISLGSIAQSCALMANEQGIQPDVVGETCNGKPPSFSWEV